ncbi:heptaprenyl diphosphate synthase [Halobacillus karajensis]|uniref:Heptaprenyl diphosphate synthase component 2 n=1 Tax=Halobacillus karajensis TaxID=195088 RepID=A0A024P132_9BACI|nr:heptaprenyl diphosphate synthase component II [Halobacillus karajensis]CDQ19497.1 Heptaprenyl diphosphate synthase component 2 [Halobacillus karajensis]CDQ21959.1 Heptaprenyl diphosphate synthase component 2 [Halobacillus karajensis]CDQ27800.1 Heptaprenyl diphosphate synthase component 2 [Halobacillus karajensis]SEH81404.1 heptaprenyl diphosphate synthase [Halobacillus karajensis]
MKLAMIYSFLKNDLAVIEKAVNETIQSDNMVLREASSQLLQAGGKRIRPVFVLLGGKFGDYNIERMKAVAVSLELIHTASLVHDDVIDEAELRRGEPTIKARWDNRIAMYTGDYIFARSLENLSALENPRAHQILAGTMVELCLGEIEQIRDKYNTEQDIRTYLRRIKRKTALLIAASCRLGAIAANVDPVHERALYQYGYYVGMSYQIIDDVLDFTASEKELGKPAGSDLLQGNITLPVLFSMEDPGFKSHLESVFQRKEDLHTDELAPLIKTVQSNGSIEKSLDISDRYLQKAYQSLAKLPANRAKQTLKGIAKYIGKRRA